MASVILWPRDPEYKEQEEFNVMKGNIRHVRELCFHDELIQPIIAKGNVFEEIKAEY